MWASLVAQWVKNPPSLQKTQEMQVPSLGQEDPLEEGMATHSSILAWRILRTEEIDGLQSIGSQKIRQDYRTKATEHTRMKKPDRLRDLSQITHSVMTEPK